MPTSTTQPVYYMWSISGAGVEKLEGSSTDFDDARTRISEIMSTKGYTASGLIGQNPDRPPKGVEIMYRIAGAVGR